MSESKLELIRGILHATALVLMVVLGITLFQLSHSWKHTSGFPIGDCVYLVLSVGFCFFLERRVPVMQKQFVQEGPFQYSRTILLGMLVAITLALGGTFINDFVITPRFANFLSERWGHSLGILEYLKSLPVIVLFTLIYALAPLYAAVSAIAVAIGIFKGFQIQKTMRHQLRSDDPEECLN